MDEYLARLFGSQPSYMGQLMGADEAERLRREAQNQGLLGAGIGLLMASGPSAQKQNIGQLIGQGLMAGQQAYRGAMQQAVQDRMMGLQLEEAAKKRQREEAFNRMLMGPTAEQQTAIAGRAMGTEGPTAAAADRLQAMQKQATPFGSLSAEQLAIARIMGPEAGSKFLGDQLKEKFSTTPTTVMIDGRPTLVQFSETGAMKTVNASPLPNEEQVDQGDRIVFRNKLTGTITGEIKKNIPPAEAKRIMLDEQRLQLENRRVAMEGQRVGMEGQRLNLAKGEFERGAYKIVDTPNGQMYVSSIPGMPAIPITDQTGQPVMGAASKMPEAQAKQVIGAQNTVNAINEFRKSLSGFTITDAANPAKRADIQLKYRNMQLQAKEAYNLGVLNGPDLAIIEQLVQDPTTVTGIFTGKKAIDKQASELSRIITDVGNVAAKRPKDVEGAKPEPPKETPKSDAATDLMKAAQEEIQKRLRARGQ